MSFCVIPRQLRAIYRRFFQKIINSRRRVLVSVLWPCFVTTIIIVGLIFDLTYKWFPIQAPEADMANLLRASTYTIFWAFFYQMSTDKSNGMEAMMNFMGLYKIAAYIGYFVAMFVALVPLIMAVAIFSVYYLFTETVLVRVTIYAVFLLFFLQLSGLIFAFSSVIRKPSKLYFICVLFVIDAGAHFVARTFAIDAPDDLKPYVLVISAFSPYVSVEMFCDSYTACKHNCQFGPLPNNKGVFVPPYYLMGCQLAWATFLYIFSFSYDCLCWWADDVEKRGFLTKLKFWGRRIASDVHVDPAYFEFVPAKQQDVAIDIKNVSKKVNKVLALNNINLEIYRRQTTILLGVKPSGKTALLELIMGKQRPDDREVSYIGLNCSSVGVLLQHNVFDPELSLYDNLYFMATIKQKRPCADDPQMQVLTVLEDLGLTNEKHKPMKEVSGNMQRLLCLGLALVGDVRTLILDDPSHGIDSAETRTLISRTIKKYAQGMTVLITTSRVEEAEYLGNRIAIIAAGRIVSVGSFTFLNRVFNNGFQFRIYCDPARAQTVTRFVHSFVPQAKMVPGSPETGSQTTLLTFEMPGGIKSRSVDTDVQRMMDFIDSEIWEKHFVDKYSFFAHSIESIMNDPTKIIKIHRENTPDTTYIQPTTNSPSARLLTQLGEERKEHIRLLRESGNLSPDIDTNIKIMATIRRKPDVGVNETQSAALYALLAKQMHTYRGYWFSLLIFRILIPLAFMFYIVRNIVNLKTYSPNANLAILIFHYVYIPTVEQASKFKTIQLSSFATHKTYWLSHFFTDFAHTIFLTASANIMLVLVANPTYRVAHIHVHTILTFSFLCFGIASSFLAYNFSRVPSRTGLSIVYFVTMFHMSPVLDNLYYMLTYPGTDSTTRRYLRNFFISVFPTDALQHVLSHLKIDCFIEETVVATACKMPEKPVSVYIGMAVLFCQAIMFYGILRYCESSRLDLAWFLRYDNMLSYWREYKKPRVSSYSLTDTQTPGNETVEQVRLARDLIKPETSKEGYELIAHNIEKSYVYPEKLVQELSFSLKKCDWFGILGYYGHGVSTTYSMLVGESKPDQGEVWCCGHYHSNAYRRYVGYVPQIEPRMCLTPREALRLMARLRRTYDTSVEDLVDACLFVLDLTKYADASYDGLDELTKRRLTLGMGIIACPRILFLDQPTTGLDNLEKLELWKRLRKLFELSGSTLVMTSHSMEELRALSTRVGIISRCGFRFVGNYTDLRRQHNSIARLRVHVHSRVDDVEKKRILEEFKKLLRESFKHPPFLQDENVNSLTYNITYTEYVKPSRLFYATRTYMQTYPALDCLFTEPSLTQIALLQDSPV